MAAWLYANPVDSLRCASIVEIWWYAFLMEKKRGPKPMHGKAMNKVVVTLDEMSLRKLKVLGEGNVSAGVRKAVEVAYAKYQSTQVL